MVYKPASMGLGGASNSTLPQQLPPALQLHILSLLPPNDCALSGRLVSPDAAAALTGPDHCTASLSQPLPPHAVPWAVEAGQQHVRQLPFRHKLQLLCTAAASGSEVNLEVALALLQPSVCHEMLQRGKNYNGADPGAAAIKAGHPQLLAWLLHYCPNLLRTDGLLPTAARYCNTEGLQAAWRLLKCYSHLLGQSVLDAAAESATPDAVAKMEWVLATAEEVTCSLQDSTAEAAARSKDLGRLHWLRDRGCPMGGFPAVEAALAHADLAVAQWLVVEAGCELPAVGTSRWTPLLLAAATTATDGAEKLTWLQELGAPQVDGNARLADSLLRAVLAGGQVEVLRVIPGLWTPDVQQKVQEHMVLAPPIGIPVATYLHDGGFVFGHREYTNASCNGDIAMVRWLANEAGVSAGGLYLPLFIGLWPNSRPQDSRDLLEAVQLLVGEAGCTDRNAKDVVCTAAERGDLALVHYLLQQLPGYQPSEDVLAVATHGGCEALLEWLAENVNSFGGGGISPYYAAAINVNRKYSDAALRGDRGTLTALRRLGVPWGAEDVVVRAVKRECPMPAVRWMVEQGAPLGDLDRLEDAIACTREGLSAGDAAWLRGVAAAAAAAAAGAGGAAASAVDGEA